MGQAGQDRERMSALGPAFAHPTAVAKAPSSSLKIST